MGEKPHRKAKLLVHDPPLRVWANPHLAYGYIPLPHAVGGSRAQEGEPSPATLVALGPLPLISCVVRLLHSYKRRLFLEELVLHRCYFMSSIYYISTN